MRALRIALIGISLACARPKEPPQKATPGVYEIAVTNQGFEPSRIEARPGETVTLRITRKVDPTCGDAVDVEGDPVRHLLPLNAPVDVRIKAPASGQIAFACPMKMYTGAVIVTAR